MPTVEDIKGYVQTIRQSSIENKKEHFTEEYEWFAKNCPKLFECALDNSFPLTFLDMMIDQIHLLDNKKTDTDSAYENVFKVLNEKYVDPLVPKKS